MKDRKIRVHFLPNGCEFPQIIYTLEKGNELSYSSYSDKDHTTSKQAEEEFLKDFLARREEKQQLERLKSAYDLLKTYTEKLEFLVYDPKDEKPHPIWEKLNQLVEGK